MLPLFPTRHWGVLPRGTPTFLLQNGNFVQPLNFFSKQGKDQLSSLWTHQQECAVALGKGADVGLGHKEKVQQPCRAS